MHYLWSGTWPANRSPQLLEFVLDGKSAYDNIYLEVGKKYKASVVISDHDGDDIEYVWDVMPESTDLGEGGDFESTPESMPQLIHGKGTVIELEAPANSGAYRIFIYANDGRGHTAHANIPFYVN
jgi:hypothetical protein